MYWHVTPYKPKAQYFQLYSQILIKTVSKSGRNCLSLILQEKDSQGSGTVHRKIVTAWTLLVCVKRVFRDILLSLPSSKCKLMWRNVYWRTRKYGGCSNTVERRDRSWIAKPLKSKAESWCSYGGEDWQGRAAALNWPKDRQFVFLQLLVNGCNWERNWNQEVGSSNC